MHKTLKQATVRPPAANFLAQQDRFDSFREEFNHERPHEALDQETPASLYTPSPRPFPKRLPKMEYPAHFERRARQPQRRHPLESSLGERHQGADGGASSGSRRWTTGSGTFTLAPCSWGSSMSAPTSSKMPWDTRTATGGCNLCPWTVVLPMSQTVQLKQCIDVWSRIATGLILRIFLLCHKNEFWPKSMSVHSAEYRCNDNPEHFGAPEMENSAKRACPPILTVVRTLGKCPSMAPILFRNVTLKGRFKWL